jgi:hypothetical protein
MNIITDDAFGAKPVVWEQIIEEVPGGAGLNVTRLDYTNVLKKYIDAGTPVYFDPATRIAEVCKSALAVDGGNSTHPRVEKTHHFAVGEILNDGTTGATVTAIDTTTSEDYDIVTVNTAVTYAAGTKYCEGAATGADTSLYFTPNGVVKSATLIAEGNADVPVVVIGTLREDALVNPIPSLYAKALRGGTSATGKSLITLR